MERALNARSHLVRNLSVRLRHLPELRHQFGRARRSHHSLHEHVSTTVWQDHLIQRHWPSCRGILSVGDQLIRCLASDRRRSLLEHAKSVQLLRLQRPGCRKSFQIREINGGEHSGSHLFRLDLHEVSTVGLDDARTQLVIEVWTPERGVRTIKRK